MKPDYRCPKTYLILVAKFNPHPINRLLFSQLLPLIVEENTIQATRQTSELSNYIIVTTKYRY